MDEIIDGIIEIIGDYHHDNNQGFAMNKEHIQSWANQFDEADQEFILTEFLHLLKQDIYISRNKAKEILLDFIKKVVSHFEYTNVEVFLRDTVFLRSQSEGKSQDVLLDYKAPYLLCIMDNQIKKVNGASIASIKVLKSCKIASNVFTLINKYSILMTFQNGSGQPIVKCLPYFLKMDKDAYKNQLKTSGENNSLLKAKSFEWLQIKVDKRLELILQYRPNMKSELIQSYRLSWFENESLALESSHAQILTKEAHNSKLYWKLYNRCLPHSFRFKTRTKHPGQDLTNVLLNYVYGIYYSMIEKCIIACGLDPSCGIFHVDGPGRKSLVYDIIEAFRHQAEEFVAIFLTSSTVMLSSYPFRTSVLPKEIKTKLYEDWRRYNKEREVSKYVMIFVEEFKTFLLKIKPEP